MGIEVKTESPLVKSIQAEAIRNSSKGIAGSTTGKATRGNVACAYYPACNRFAWFVNGEPETKAYATHLLMGTVSRKKL